MSVMYDRAPLDEKVQRALSNDFQHRAIEAAQDAIGAKRDEMVADAGEDWERMRTQAARIRDHVLSNLDFYLKRFADAARAAGCNVHFAPTAADAVDAVLDVFEELGETSCVKSKSMMTEEIGLNAKLSEAGITPIETDCAEHILQTAQSAPSHIVVPALHFNRKAIQKLYREKMGYQGSDDPAEITRFLRTVLRPQFMSAHVGITGCNFAVAETGSCTLVTNEGNARMVTCAPENQIIVMGAERIVPDLRSLDVMVALLSRSAVGSKITSSFSLNTGTRRPGEADGPARVDIVIVDNGRSRILGGEYSTVLRCIRCGACMNTCPVYRHISGHGYGSIYPGPIGVVLTPLLEGYESAGKLTAACTLCGACASVCPVKIPLNSLILHHRNDMNKLGMVGPIEKRVFGAAGAVLSSVKLYRTATRVGSFGMKALAGKRGRLGKLNLPVVIGWTCSRDLDVLAPRKFRDLFDEHERARAACQGEKENR